MGPLLISGPDITSDKALLVMLPLCLAMLGCLSDILLYFGITV